jgi:hypothetical protein
MTGAQIISLANSIADDTIPSDYDYILLNIAKNKREDMRPWEMLKKSDATKTAAVGDTYQTAKALPSDWRYTYLLMVGTDLKYGQIPFEQQYIYKDAAQKFFVDVANLNYYLTGLVNTSKTIYHFYIKSTTDYTVATTGSSLIVWPERFQPLLAFDMAAMYKGGIDYDDINARMAPDNRAEARAIELAMISWDNELKRRAMGETYTGYGDSPGIPLGQM